MLDQSKSVIEQFVNTLAYYAQTFGPVADQSTNIPEFVGSKPAETVTEREEIVKKRFIVVALKFLLYTVSKSGGGETKLNLVVVKIKKWQIGI
jgi:hypothetical protein